MNFAELTNNFNCYDGSNNTEKLVGVTGSVTLPEIEMLSETLTAAGVLGEIDAVAIGHTSAMESEIQFNNLQNNIFQFMSPKKGVHFILRASVQMKNTATNAISNIPIRIVEKGTFKKFTGGTIEGGKPGKPSVTFSVDYILIEINKKSVFELDKLNGVFKVNGEDVVGDIMKQC